MSFVKPAALFLCVALAGCAGKTDRDEISYKEKGDKPGVAAKTAEVGAAKTPAEKEKQQGSWWSLGGKEEDKPAKAVAPSKAEAAKVSKTWLEDHEKRLRAAIAGSKFEVERRGDVLVVVAPADPTFNPDRPHMLMPATLGPLSRVAKLVGGDPLNAVLILGHADNKGDAERNRKLSLERAQAVASIFRMSGLKGDRLALRGLGSDKPRATNDSASGRAQNRRVEMLVTRRDSLSALLVQNGR